jgi:hypothetical protein
LHALDAVFWTCLLLGGGYTLITLVLGGVGQMHGAGDAGAVDSGAIHIGASDAGAFDTGTVDAGSFDTGSIHAGGVDAGVDASATGIDGGVHGHDATGHQGTGATDGAPVRIHLMSYMNPMAVAGFLLGFGGIGIMSRSQGAGALTSIAGGFLGGYALWLSAYLLVTRVFATARGTSHYRPGDVIGASGIVSAPISPGKPGMISLTVAGSRQSIRAIVVYDDEVVPVGATVRIRRLEHGTAHVVLEENALTARHMPP